MTKNTDNLELFLRDVYENECVFKTEKAEVDFIQTGVETLIQRLVQETILVNDPIWEEIEQDLESFRSRGGKISKFQGNIIKVGSFYEGTKNDFPCEFDLIYPFYNCEETKGMDGWLKGILQTILGRTNQLIVQQTYNLQDKNDLYYSSSDGGRILYFDRYIGKSRPAMTMNLIFETKSGLRREISESKFGKNEEIKESESSLRKEINVDLVPAALITGGGLQEIVNTYCGLDPFCNEVMSMGKILMVDGRITFTETEVYIMVKKLSANHRKIYRVLKYLINGNGETAGTFSKCLDMKPYSSYMIKTAIIYHHFECKNLESMGLGPCLLDVLTEMCKHKYDDTFPSLVKNPYIRKGRSKLFLLGNLQAMTQSLKWMQQSDKCYDYEKDKNRRSVSENYIYESRRHSTIEEEDEEEMEKIRKMVELGLFS